MKVLVKVKTGARKNFVERAGEGQFIVFTKKQPEKGRANQAVLRLLAKHFKKPPEALKIAKGLKSKQKIIEIN